MINPTPFILTERSADLKDLTMLTSQSHFADARPSFVLKSLLLTIELARNAQMLSWYFCFRNTNKRWLSETFNAQNSNLYSIVTIFVFITEIA